MTAEAAVTERVARSANLDIFRGICALTVFVYHLMAHVSYSNFMPQGSVQFRLFEFLWPIMQQLSTYAVLGFFVLSGYVITLYAQRMAREGRGYLEFLIFRFLRISLVCAPVALVSVALAYYYQTSNPGPAWPRYQNYDIWLIIGSMTGFAREWNWPGWTLIIEWNFYFIVAMIGSLTRPSPIHVAIAIGCGMYLLFGPGLRVDQTLTMSFFIGVYLTTLRSGVEGKGLALVVAGVASMVWLLTQPELTVGYNNALLKTVPVALLVLAFSTFPAWSGRLAGVLHFLGKVSFSLYVWHWPVILFGNYYLFGRGSAATADQAAFMFSAYPVAVLVVAYVSWWLFERDYKLVWLRSQAFRMLTRPRSV